MQVDLSEFSQTFNVVTIVTAVVTGLMFGYFAILPILALIVPTQPPTLTPRQSALLGFVFSVVMIGSVVLVFYVEQIISEIALGLPQIGRAIGRLATFAVFLVAFALGVALDVYRTEQARRK